MTFPTIKIAVAPQHMSVRLRNGGISAQPQVIPPDFFGTDPMVCWFRADMDTYADAALTTPAANGGVIRGWKDQGPLALHMTNGGGGGALMTWNTNYTPTGLPACRFTGNFPIGTSFLSSSGVVTQAAPITVFLVTRLVSTIAPDIWLGMIADPGTNKWFGPYPYSNPPQVDIYTFLGGSSKDLVVDWPTDQWFVFSWVWRTDGVPSTLQRGTGTASNVLNSITLDVGVVPLKNSPMAISTKYGIGDFAELIIYRRELTDPYRLGIVRYLMQKYGINDFSDAASAGQSADVVSEFGASSASPGIGIGHDAP